MKISEAIRELHGTNELTYNCPEDCEGGFSSYPCEGCGSPLGGDRHPAGLFDGDTRLDNIEICVDCMFYLANGEDVEQGEY